MSDLDGPPPEPGPLIVVLGGRQYACPAHWPSNIPPPGPLGVTPTWATMAVRRLGLPVGDLSMAEVIAVLRMYEGQPVASCRRCHGAPPAGYICGVCGSGPYGPNLGDGDD